ncbi:ribonuclease H2 non-catalytic subunit-domain-containing protein [Corynascus novoguineensis]|uniref:Ribonuclease H2 non-catalytic subunit-domain-containing protein n=1 Tax=Corynascus novoguineensis TaxID=1126955 RepID=A0AAN7CQS4_9PEZI|nr:ribonuclease H2 non-catalytic subunit-domain-containing protein [Corynascus novoguineensis]
MSQPMLRVEKSETPSGDSPKATPHLLPCRVHHNGPAEPAQSFWNARVGESGARTAYFRGRKLQGTAVKLPDGYRGIVAVTSAPEQPSRRSEEPEVVDLEQSEPPHGSLQVQAEFDEMVVWGHEQPVDAAADPYLRGAAEWLALAEKIHSYPAQSTKGK